MLKFKLNEATGCMSTEDSKENLCDACSWHIGECLTLRIVFGDGVGNDNVIECASFYPKPEFKERCEEVAKEAR